MSNYTQNVFFAPKDALITGDPDKKIKGTEIDAELSEISTAIASKENTANKGVASGYASLDGSVKVPSAQLPAATESAVGAVELATSAEAVTGSDTARAVTPAGVQAKVAAALTDAAITTSATISGNVPRLTLTETDAGTDEKSWQVRADGSGLVLYTLNDAGSAIGTALTLSRTGTTPTVWQFAGTSFLFNGVSINSAAGLTTGTLPDARIQASGVTQHQASLSIAETQIPDGSVLARVGSNETISGTWTFTNLTINGALSGNLTFSGAPKKTSGGAFPYFGSATQSSGIITIGTAAVSGTPGAGDIYIQHEA